MKPKGKIWKILGIICLAFLGISLGYRMIISVAKLNFSDSLYYNLGYITAQLLPILAFAYVIIWIIHMLKE